jgi:S1-C subfamily serine protease
VPGSAAAAAGILPSDVLLAVAGLPVTTLGEYAAALKTHAPGERVAVRVRRGEQELELEATLGER